MNRTEFVARCVALVAALKVGIKAEPIDEPVDDVALVTLYVDDHGRTHLWFRGNDGRMAYRTWAGDRL